jgi:hypothetical protein
MRDMSDAVHAREYSNATARVAKERIERVRNGEDAGLKQPFDPSSPAYVAAFANAARVVRDMYLIDDEKLEEIAKDPEIVADQQRRARQEAEWEAKRTAARENATRPPAKAGAAIASSSRSSAAGVPRGAGFEAGRLSPSAR